MQRKSGTQKRNQKSKSLHKQVQKDPFESCRMHYLNDEDIVGCNCTNLYGGKVDVVGLG